MKRTSTIILCGVMGLWLSFNAAADIVFSDGGASLQGILDDHTIDPLGNSSVDVTIDALPDADDSHWSVTAAGGNISTLVVELTGFANNNKFGIYDKSDHLKQVELFDGAALSGAMALVSIRDDGSVWVNFADTGIDFAANQFGYYLDSTHSDRLGGLWYSDTSLNDDNTDHMAAYQGKGTDVFKIGDWSGGLWTQDEYILAFEDVSVNSAYAPDYDDFIVMVESVTPVPEPATMVLLGLGGLVLRKGKKRTI